jgi:hypothetical protein
VENQSKLGLFQGQFGSASASTTKQLTNEEWCSIMLYVLLNSPEGEEGAEGEEGEVRTNKNSSVSSGLHRGCQGHTKLIPLFRKVLAHSGAISFHGSGERPKPICPSLVSCVMLHVAVN